MPTLEEAKARLEAELPRGTVCPCCDRFTKLYRRKLTSGMARLLITLLRKTAGPEWFSVSDILKAAAGNTTAVEYSKLRYWGLLEENPNTNGQWRVTDLGKQFVNEGALVQQYILLHNGDLKGLDGKQVSINDVLGDNFDFDELMTPAGSAGN